MKHAFVFYGLGCGGIERVGIDYCNALCNAGNEIKEKADIALDLLSANEYQDPFDGGGEAEIVPV